MNVRSSFFTALFVSALMLSAPMILCAQVALQTPDAPDEDQPQRVVLTVYPAAPSKPALRYALLHEVIDQKPGNAALAYERAVSQLNGEQYVKDTDALFRQWSEIPLADLPLEEMKQALGRYSNVMEQLEFASLYESCDWQTTIREHGFHTLLLHLSPMRQAARLLSAQIRYDIAVGDFDQAIRHLRIGFTLAKQVSQGQTLIEGLVGISISALMLERVRELIQQPSAPNLYWPITDLGQPFLDPRQSVSWERWWLYATLPKLKDARKGKYSVELCRELMVQLPSIEGGWSNIDQREPSLTLQTTGVAVALYPQAKQYLLAHGRTAEQVEAMPVAEALLTTLLEGYETQRDDLFKWYSLPYWQAADGMRRIDDQLKQSDEMAMDTFLARFLLPSLQAARSSYVSLEQQIALARCVEMIRQYAAENDGRLPASLADVRDAAVPIDSATGQPIAYRVENDRAIIEAPAPKYRPKSKGFVYEVRAAKRD